MARSRMLKDRPPRHPYYQEERKELEMRLLGFYDRGRALRAGEILRAKGFTDREIEAVCEALGGGDDIDSVRSYSAAAGGDPGGRPSRASRAGESGAAVPKVVEFCHVAHMQPNTVFEGVPAGTYRAEWHLRVLPFCNMGIEEDIELYVNWSPQGTDNWKKLKQKYLGRPWFKAREGTGWHKYVVFGRRFDGPDPHGSAGDHGDVYGEWFEVKPPDGERACRVSAGMHNSGSWKFGVMLREVRLVRKSDDDGNQAGSGGAEQAPVTKAFAGTATIYADPVRKFVSGLWAEGRIAVSDKAPLEVDVVCTTDPMAPKFYTGLVVDMDMLRDMFCDGHAGPVEYINAKGRMALECVMLRGVKGDIELSDKGHVLKFVAGGANEQR